MSTTQQPQGQGQTYPKTRRLIKTIEYKRVFNHGSKVVCPQLVMLHAGAHDRRSRIGIVASRKVGGAVTRNRIKRTLREIYRTLPYSISGDLVIIARNAAGQGSYKDLALAFDQCYKRLAKKLEMSL
jgi:ribonuclease P protein component